ncbi:MAG: MATE family efflux transporter [Gammaproteobacteria bacterium]|nr:MATE family efflux transporter [Gammaproteobacteria bacterium]
MAEAPKTWLPTLAAERRSILQISGPLIGAYLAEMGMIITDMIIVGRLGSVELAAVGLGGDWFYVLLLIGIGVLSIVGVLIAQARGAGEDSRVSGYVRQGLVVATLLTVPIAILSWYLSPLLGLTGQDPEVLQRIDDYMHPLTFAVWPALVYVVFRNYLTAYENTSIFLVLTLVALGVNAVLNIVLVHGKLGLPALGVAGAGIGTTIIHWLLLGALMWYLHKEQRLRFRALLGERASSDRGALAEIVRLGLPISATYLMNGGLFTVAAVMMGALGAAYLAAQQLVYALLYCAISISIGIGDAAKVRVAYALGKHSPLAMRQAAGQCLLFGGIVCLVFSLGLWLLPDYLFRVFLNFEDSANAATITVALTLTVFAGCFQIIDGIHVIIGNALRGLRDTRTPMWAALVGYWVCGVCLGWVLCFPVGLGAAGIWWGMLVGVGIACLWMLAKFYFQTAQLLSAQATTSIR